MPAWFVSYAWRDDTSQAGLMREQRVDQACEAARERGVVIHRDKDVLRPGDSIERFMRGIGAGDRIFVFLSDKYLRSPFCMFELCEVWRQSRQDSENWGVGCGYGRWTTPICGPRKVGPATRATGASGTIA